MDLLCQCGILNGRVLKGLKSSRKMNGGGRRQLPSWMQRPSTGEQASISELKRESKENDSEELDTKASKPQKTVQRIKHEIGASLAENDSRVLKKCEGRKRGRKSIKQDSGTTQAENEPPLLRHKRKRVSNKHGEDEADGLVNSNVEDSDGSVRKRCLDNAPSKDHKKKKVNKIMEDSHDASPPSEDDLTVEDLVSIAEEYVNAHMEKELQSSQKLEKSEIKPLYGVRSEKDPTMHKKDNNSQILKPIPSTSSLTDPSPVEQSIIYPSNTGDPARDMLDLFFGDLLRKSEQMERNNGAMAENVVLDHELSKRSQTDIVVEKVPEMKKKSSIRDKVAMYLD